MSNWRAFQQGTNALGNQLAETKQAEQQRNQAMQDMIMKALLPELVKKKYGTPGKWEPTTMKESIDYERQKANLDTLKSAQSKFFDRFINQQQPVGQPATQDGVQPVGQPSAGGFRPESFTAGGFGFKREKTERDIQQELDLERRKQAQKGLPGESAGKLTMLNQALSDLESVEKMLFPSEGKFAKGLATAANIPGGRFPGIPSVGFGTKAREISSKMNNALEAKLRIETGAAATQEEFNRLQDRFGITFVDSITSAKDKIRRLKEFMRNAIVTIDPTGRFIYKGKGTEGLNTQVDNQLDSQINQMLDQMGAD